MKRTLLAALIFTLLIASGTSRSADAEPADEAPDGLADDLLKGGTVVRLVSIQNAEPLATKVYWRHYAGRVAAQTTPVRFLLDNVELIAPRKIVDKKTQGIRTLFPTEARKDISNGKHVLLPGDIPLEMEGGKLSSSHPAIKISGQDVHILCAPVRLEALDKNGAPVATTIKITCGKEPLLRESDNFEPLIIWLPVGLKYVSTLGSFSLAADGKISAEAAELAANVKLNDSGLTLTLDVEKPISHSIENPRVIEHSPGEKKKSIRCYVEPLLKAGEAARIAISKSQYESATKTPLDPRSFSYALSAGRSAGPLANYSASLASAAPPAIEQLAARGLNTEVADLAWFNLPVPKSVSIGVLNYSLSEKSFGTLRGWFIVADAAAALQVIPHRLRTVFADTEIAPYTVLIAPGFAGGEARILCRADSADAKPLELGKLTLPAAAKDFDSRLYTLAMRDIPPGAYRIWLESPSGVSPLVSLTVVSWLRRSSFLVHAMAACGGMWPTDDAGLQSLQDAGMEMVCAGGFGSPYNTELPALDTRAAEWLTHEPQRFPAEAAIESTGNDLLLERLLSHQIRHVDFYPRGENFYLEGLSYHHSFKPSVDRMIRRLQVFTQQTQEYPSFWGINYTWFPSLFGYSEGGVDTDIHKRDRNAALEMNLKAAGLEGLTKEERKSYDENKFSPDADKRAKALALMQKAVAHWKGQMNFGFGKHNKMYNDAVRQVRPDAVCVLYENAGHDENKRTRSLFNDMDAMTYESYSDYPEWPMSASFTTDWSRGNFPGRNVWITVDYGSTSEGMMKSMFHAFGRGAGGSGTLMPEDATPQERARRGMGLRFVSQYGAIPAHATPDHRFAILSTAAEQILSAEGRTQYAYHAMYYHLTRLGCAPVIVDDEDAVNAGIPNGVKVLFVVKQRQPLEPKVSEVIDAFMKKGGKVIVTGDSLIKIPDAIVIDKSIKHIWDFSGFQPKSHAEMWTEFESVWRGPLSEALAKTGVMPAASTDPDRGMVVSLDGGAIRYAVVISDEKSQPLSAFKPTAELPVSLEGTDWQVRDLAKQQTLKTSEKDGRTLVKVDLITEPATVLAFYKAAPGSIEIKTRGTPTLGSELIFTCDASTTKGGTSLGALPVKYELLDPAGKSRTTLYRAAGEETQIPLPALAPSGAWKLRAQELITGVSATLELNLAPATQPVIATQEGNVHVVNAAHLQEFFKHAGEKRVVIEPGQERLLPLAKKLVDELIAAGVKARLWHIRPENFDTIPVRWYPRADEDAPRLKDVDAGNLIGLRENMKPFIDAQKRAHIPEKGGYAEIEPLLMVGTDCIVFSGGEISEALRAVSPWMGTPHVPGKSQGRLLACFSPFCADRHALAIIANDDEGLAKAAARVAAFNVPAKETLAKKVPLEDWKTQNVSLETLPVPQPFIGYAPMRRVTRLLATPEGKALVFLDGKKDTRAFVDAAGKITATVSSDGSDVAHAQIDSEGRCWETFAKHLGGEWYNQEITLRGIGPDGALQREMLLYSGSVFYTELPTDWQGGFPVAPDGSVAALGVLGGMLLGKFGDAQWLRYDDVPNVPVRDAIRHPRFPVGARFSPDGKCVLLTMDTRPPGWGGMNWPAENPSASETILLDATSGKVIWQLRDEKNIRKTGYAVHTGFGAVSNDGKITAFADYLGSIYLVDKAGSIVQQQQIATQAPTRYSTGPQDGVGVWMNPEGSLAAFGYKNLLVLTQGKSAVRVPLVSLVSACVSGDGSLAIAALESGEVKAFDTTGAAKWSVTPGGIAPRIAAAGANQTLVATSLGDLVLLDASGKEIRRTNVVEAADREKHELKASAQFQRLAHPRKYIEPHTLELAKKELAAQQIAAWKSTAPGVAAFEKTFFLLDAPITLAAPADSKEKDFFVHVVYRKPAENKSLTLSAESKEGAEKFLLDLPTPEYRVIDIPVRGAAAKVTLASEGPVEIAECSLWSIRWPSANVAFVQPAKSAGMDISKESGPELDGLLGDIDGDAGLKGKMKACKIFSPNPDVDKVSGPYLKPGIDALQMVDGKRFGNGKLLPWVKEAFVGCWFTVEFGKAVPLKLVATYDRAQKQSELSVNIAVFSVSGGIETVRAGSVQNDQFWRIFALSGEKIPTLGVHVFSGKADGLSEIEAYQAEK